MFCCLRKKLYLCSALFGKIRFSESAKTDPIAKNTLLQ